MCRRKKGYLCDLIPKKMPATRTVVRLHLSMHFKVYPHFLLLIISVHFLLAGCSQPGNMDVEQLSFLHDSLKPTPSTQAHYTPETITGTIYLTFDDGPLYGSENINRIIENEKIKVNVFVVGKHAETNEKLKEYYRLYSENPFVEIGNHSYTHALGKYREFYSNTPGAIRDFEKCQKNLGIPTMLARLPGRNQWRLNSVSKNDIGSGTSTSDSLQKIGFKIYGWDIEWNKNSSTGGPKQSVEYMVELIDKRLRDSSTVKPGHIILLAHDEMFKNTGAMELQKLIGKLKATNKYAFEHLSNYPG